MSVKSAQSVARSFTTRDPSTGAATAATGTPTGALIKNGVATADVVTITGPVGTSRYKWSVTLPTLASGDQVAIEITAVVSGVTDSAVVWEDSADADLVLDLTDGIETNFTFRQVMRLMAAVLLGKTSDYQKTFRDLNDTKDRIVSTVDSNSNRTAVTRDAT